MMWDIIDEHGSCLRKFGLDPIPIGGDRIELSQGGRTLTYIVRYRTFKQRIDPYGLGDVWFWEVHVSRE